MDAWFMGPGGSVTHRDPETKTTSTYGLWTGRCVDMWVGVCTPDSSTVHMDMHMWPPDPDTKRNDLETQDTGS